MEYTAHYKTVCLWSMTVRKWILKKRFLSSSAFPNIRVSWGDTPSLLLTHCKGPEVIHSLPTSPVSNLNRLCYSSPGYLANKQCFPSNTVPHAIVWSWLPQLSLPEVPKRASPGKKRTQGPWLSAATFPGCIPPTGTREPQPPSAWHPVPILLPGVVMAAQVDERREAHQQASFLISYPHSLRSPRAEQAQCSSSRLTCLLAVK